MAKMSDMVISVVQTSTTLSSFQVSDASTKSEVLFAIHPRTSNLVEIDPSQTWFWAPDWLADEIMIDRELENGEYDEFDNIDDFIKSI